MLMCLFVASLGVDPAWGHAEDQTQEVELRQLNRAVIVSRLDGSAFARCTYVLALLEVSYTHQGLQKVVQSGNLQFKVGSTFAQFPDHITLTYARILNGHQDASDGSIRTHRIDVHRHDGTFGLRIFHGTGKVTAFSLYQQMEDKPTDRIVAHCPGQQPKSVLAVLTGTASAYLNRGQVVVWDGECFRLCPVAGEAPEPLVSLVVDNK